MTPFSEQSLRSLLESIKNRACSFKDVLDAASIPSFATFPLYLRFDIDNDLPRAKQMAQICTEYGIRATFFILNTAPYWHRPDLFNILNEIQDHGHEIGWHNNVVTEWLKATKRPIASLIDNTLTRFRSNGIKIRGSASHGDSMCRQLQYLNYEVFEECARAEEAFDFPPRKIEIQQVKMSDFGLEYEAYHVPYDLYLSESGGRQWTARKGATQGTVMTMESILQIIPTHERIQILIHPQHWKI